MPINQVAMVEAVDLELDSSTAGNPDYVPFTMLQADGLTLSHNDVDGARLTASAVANAQNVANDVTLSLAECLLVAHGKDQAEQLIWELIPPGVTQLDLPWEIAGSLAGTAAGSLQWTVTITQTAD